MDLKIWSKAFICATLGATQRKREECRLLACCGRSWTGAVQPHRTLLVSQGASRTYTLMAVDAAKHVAELFTRLNELQHAGMGRRHVDLNNNKRLSS